MAIIDGQIVATGAAVGGIQILEITGSNGLDWMQ